MQGIFDEAAVKALLQDAIAQMPRGGQSALARAVGVEPQTVNKWSRGHTCPAPRHWALIERHLGWPEGRIAKEGRLGDGASIQEPPPGLVGKWERLSHRDRRIVERIVDQLLADEH